MQRASPPGSQSQQQQTIMRIMPLMFAVFGLQVVSGLVVYWTVSNLFQLGQQTFLLRAGHIGPEAIERRLAEQRERSASPTPPKEGLMQRLQRRVTDVQKTRTDQGEPPAQSKDSASGSADLSVERCFYSLPTFARSISLEVTRGKGTRAFWARSFHEEHEDREGAGSFRSCQPAQDHAAPGCPAEHVRTRWAEYITTQSSKESVVRQAFRSWSVACFASGRTPAPGGAHVVSVPSRSVVSLAAISGPHDDRHRLRRRCVICLRGLQRPHTAPSRSCAGHAASVHSHNH